MNKYLSKIKFAIKKIKSFFPQTLPQGVSAFTAWSDDVIELAGLPNNDSIRFTLATMILHLPSTESAKPKHYFVKALHKSAANQVAAYLIQDLKTKQQEAMKAAEAAKQAEATALTGSPSVPIQN